MRKIFLLFSLFLCSQLMAQGGFKTYEANWESLQSHEVPKWFQDAKFGIYFHWGIYSYIGMGEWYPHYMYQKGNKLNKYHKETYGDKQYHEFIPYFTAEHFDAEDWAELFKASGAKFAGPVAEHCDNFSNWDSKVNKYNAMNMGPKRDILGELSKSVRKAGLKFITSFHHSWEWGWYPTWNGLVDTTAVGFEDFYGERTLPEAFGYFSTGVRESGQFNGVMLPKYCPSRKFVNMWKAKIFEVVDKYQPDFLWFDSRLFLIPDKDRQEMVAYYYNKEKEWGRPVGLSYKQKDLPVGVGVLDFERGRMNEKTDFPWLTDDSWAWNAWSWKKKMDLKTPDNVVDELSDIVSKNGCLLLNITPTSDGKIPEEMRNGLIEVGKWLKVNGEAIYNTRTFDVYGEGPTKLKPSIFGGVQARNVEFTPADFRFTRNGSNVYIIQLGIPQGSEQFVVTSFADYHGKIKSLRVLGSREKIKWNIDKDGLHIAAPKNIPNDYALVYKVELK